MHLTGPAQGSRQKRCVEGKGKRNKKAGGPTHSRGRKKALSEEKYRQKYRYKPKPNIKTPSKPKQVQAKITDYFAPTRLFSRKSIPSPRPTRPRRKCAKYAKNKPSKFNDKTARVKFYKRINDRSAAHEIRSKLRSNFFKPKTSRRAINTRPKRKCANY